MQIGQIISLTGDAIHVSKDGTSRPAAVDDPVAEGDQIILLSPNSSVLLITPSGERLLLNQYGKLDEQPGQATDTEPLLIDDEFDLSALPAPSAGPQDTSSDSGSGEHGSGHYAPDISTTTSSSLLIDDAPLISLTPATIEELATNPDNTRPLTPQAERDEQTAWNDTEPRLLGTEHHAVTEDFIITRQGNLQHQLDLRPQTFDTTHGQVEVGTDGIWHYQLHNDNADIQALGAGESLLESFSLQTRNGDYVDINLTIHGSNDTPSIRGQSLAQLLEDHGDQFRTQSVSVSGQLSIADADNGQSQFIGQESIETPYGIASLQSDGAWLYELHAHSDFVQGLKEGQHVFDAFHAYTVDGTRHTIRIDIEGSNDKPILSGQNDGLIELGQTTHVAGKIDIVDPDFGESTFQANPEIVGKYGAASIDASGHWQYTVDDSRLASLPEGKKIYDVLNVFTEDGTRQDLVIKIVGSTSSQEMLLSSSETLELNTILQDSSTDPSLDSLLGSAIAPDWSTANINSGEALSLALSDTTLSGLNPLSNHVDVA